MAVPSGKKRKIFDGRYEVIEIVGRGTDSVVYHARHAASPTQEVALKVLLSQKDRASVTERLRKEALTLVSCRHKFVVRLDDFHSIGDLCYLSMEFAREGDLRKYAAKLQGPLPIDTGERFLRQTLEAIDFVHATGVIHRDIKPDNILVLNEREIRLADFGLALLPGDEPGLDELQAGVGSFSYLPPEVLEGTRYDARSDLYAVGLCFYEIFSGKHPFDNLPLAQQMEARTEEGLPPLREVNTAVPAYLSDVITKLMRFNAEDRFTSALEALRGLDAGAGRSEGSPAPRASASTKAPNTRGAEAKAAAAAAPTVQSPATVATTVVEIPNDKPAPLGGAANVDKPLATKTDVNLRNVFDAPQEAFDTPDGDDPFDARVEQTLDSRKAPSPGTKPEATPGSDIDRIKEILAKDATQREQVASRRAAHERATLSASSAVPALDGNKNKPTSASPLASRTSQKATKLEHPAASKSSLSAFSSSDGGLLGWYRRVPPVIRPLILGLMAAIATVLVLAVMQMVSSRPKQTAEIAGNADAVASSGPQDSASNDSAPTQPSQDVARTDSGGFPVVASGMYAGRIAGVIPGIVSPLTLLSIPQRKLLAVIVGIDGWSPTMVSTASVPEGSNVLTVQSNGIVLKITGRATSDTIDGTFENLVSGEKGEWMVRRVS